VLTGRGLEPRQRHSAEATLVRAAFPPQRTIHTGRAGFARLRRRRGGNDDEFDLLVDMRKQIPAGAKASTKQKGPRKTGPSFSFLRRKKYCRTPPTRTSEES
jgi:hypothetical protein